MRPAALLALAAAAAGCTLTDCPPVSDPVPFRAAEVRLDAAPVADTLTVVFVFSSFEDEISMGSAPPRPVASADGALRLTVDGDVYSGPRAFPQFETAVRGDTVFVRRALVQQACSPVIGTHLRVTRIEAPPGVRAVRVWAGWAGDVPFPASAAPAGRPPAFFTV